MMVWYSSRDKEVVERSPGYSFCGRLGHVIRAGLPTGYGIFQVQMFGKKRGEIGVFFFVVVWIGG